MSSEDEEDDEFMREKAKKRESKGLQKITFKPACISALKEMLHDIYTAGHPTPEDYNNRRDLVRVFNMMAKEVYGSSNDFPVVEVFGSFVMDMFSAKSDLDLSINFSSDLAEYPREKKIDALRKFAKLLYPLQRRGHVYGVHPIMSARVPILKVVDRGSGIECDISVENKDAIAKSQIVHIISAIDERFQILSSLIKTWAKAYDINSSKDRTLNSLSIILLVAFHFQTRDPPILPPFKVLLKDGSDPENVRKVVQDFLQYGKRNEESVAELFVTLLSKLASVETLWPKGLCASTYEGSWISKTWEYKVCLMNVEDFMDRSENSARSVGGAALKKIYRCINSSLHHLSSFMDGRIQAPKLKELLFGRDSPSTADEHSALSLKGSLPFHEGEGATPPDQVPMKKTRLTEGWSSWGEKQQPPLTMRPWGGNQLRPSTLQPCGRKQVSPSAWPPWGEDRSSPSTWPPWGENQSLPSTWHPWGEDQSPTPTRQPWGEDQLPTSTWHPWGEDQLSPSITRSWGENQLSPSTVGSWRRDESSHSAWRPWGENQSSSPSWQPCAEVQSFPSAWRSWGEDQCGGTPAGFSHSTPFVHPQ